jgi:OOP family OmpA-OmpF porin
MKYKALSLSLLLAGACATSSFAQDTNYTLPKGSDNIFVGAGVGVMSVANDGFNTPTFNFNISLGKYLTPTWGVRAQVSGIWQSLEPQDNLTNYSKYCKKFGELNLDAMFNVINAFAGYNPDRKLDITLFAGPTMNVAKGTSLNIEGTNYEFVREGLRTRFGATVGLDLGYNLSNKWALNLEGRLGIAPSVFGYGSDCRVAEGTGRLTIGAIYTFGGKKFKSVAASSKEVVKEVPVEVVKEVPVEVVKEVVKEVPGQASAAIFFKIGKSVISDEGMVNVKLMAKVIKNNPNSKYEVAGYADKGTGSVAGNQTLSEKRAQAVYDALLAEGVNADQLVKVAKGGTDPMFEKANLNRVVILEMK